MRGADMQARLRDLQNRALREQEEAAAVSSRKGATAKAVQAASATPDDAFTGIEEDDSKE